MRLGSTKVLLLCFGTMACRHHDASKATHKPAATAAGSPAGKTGDCSDGMVLIPAGTFMMGTTPGDSRDPLHQVTITKPYCIDRMPVTVAQYRRCVVAGVCSVPKKPLDYNYDRAGRDQHPVNAVTWTQADTYCKWARKRLPTNAEWELAARGTDGREYPWGNQQPDDTRLHWSHTTERIGTAPVGSYPAGASPYGVLDMLGNVSQWVADWDRVYPRTPEVDPLGPVDGESKVLRGDAYDSGRLGTVGPGTVYSGLMGRSSPSTGFRCATRR